MCRGVFRILILRVLSVNRIFPLRVLTAGAISLFLNITGAIAPMAPVLNTPLTYKTYTLGVSPNNANTTYYSLDNMSEGSRSKTFYDE